VGGGERGRKKLFTGDQEMGFLAKPKEAESGVELKHLNHKSSANT
jgi:hypothetical protein